jgi:hypothetical protein
MTVPIKVVKLKLFCKISIINNKYKFWSTMLEERLNYLSILSIENNITKLLPHDMVIKEYVVKCGKKLLQRCIRQFSKKRYIIFLDFVMFVAPVCFLKSVICCDFFLF